MYVLFSYEILSSLQVTRNPDEVLSNGGLLPLGGTEENGKNLNVNRIRTWTCFVINNIREK